jgi:catalase
VTHDITEITSAKFLGEVGKKTKVFMRLFTVGGEKGSSDTVRDIRGFAIKSFTEEGNHDIVGNDLPVFFIRDPVKFPSLNRSHKKHPQTAVPDSTMFWDFHNNNQEGVHCQMQLFGDRGVPKSLRNINGYGVHTFKFGRPGDGTLSMSRFISSPTLVLRHSQRKMQDAWLVKIQIITSVIFTMRLRKATILPGHSISR